MTDEIRTWTTLHCTSVRVKQLLLNVNQIESMVDTPENEVVIRMISGKQWTLKDYDVDELSEIFWVD